MNKKKKDKKERRNREINWIYGLIVVVANVLGSQFPGILTSGTVASNNLEGWIAFMNQHQTVIQITSILSFVFPTVACVSYLSFAKKEKVQGRFINVPMAYSLRGVLGWVVYFLTEIVLLLIAKKQMGINVEEIIYTSLFYLVLQCLFSFTLAYFLMETIHRRFTLPKYFPDGNLWKYKGVKRSSIKLLVTIFYISTGIFPAVYILFEYINNAKILGFAIDKSFFWLLGFVFLISFVICITFAQYFSKPLQKLKMATEKIKKGEYGTRVKVVCNDSFGDLADAFNEMSESLKEQTDKIMAIQNSVIKGMAIMVESRDNSTGGHIMRTSDCVQVFVNQLKKHPKYGQLSEKFYDDLIKAAPMHDLGKIAVDDAVLRKPGKFTDEEYEKMKAHSVEGARIVENVLLDVDDQEFKKIAINVAHYHHEKWNGTGYPEKIAGETIPLEARIMALADVFDALVSKRCYKDCFSYDKAFDIIKESLGTHFDAELGEEFLKSRPQLEELYNGYNK